MSVARFTCEITDGDELHPATQEAAWIVTVTIPLTICKETAQIPVFVHQVAHAIRHEAAKEPPR